MTPANNTPEPALYTPRAVIVARERKSREQDRHRDRINHRTTDRRSAAA